LPTFRGQSERPSDSEHTKRYNKRIVLALLSVYLIWGSTYLAVRIAVESMPPLLMTSSRLFIAGLLLFIILLIRSHARPSRRQWLSALIVGGLMLGGGAGFTAFAEQWVESGLAAVLIATVPLWATLMAGVWEQWPSRIEWFGLILGLAGVIMLNTENNLQANPLGAIALLIAPITWALGSVLSRRLDLAKGPMAIASEMLAGSVVLLLLAALSGERINTMPTTASIAAWFYLTLFGSLIGFSSYMYLLQTTPITLATSYAYVNPVIAVLLGVFLADESMSWSGVLAMGIILAAVIIMTFTQRTTHPSPTIDLTTEKR
jgi:drug/metabolite transporter (DMT)-like permease